MCCSRTTSKGFFSSTGSDLIQCFASNFAKLPIRYRTVLVHESVKYVRPSNFRAGLNLQYIFMQKLTTSFRCYGVILFIDTNNEQRKNIIVFTFKSSIQQKRLTNLPTAESHQTYGSLNRFNAGGLLALQSGRFVKRAVPILYEMVRTAASRI